MSFYFAIESLKFYKLKQSQAVQGLFITTFLLNVYLTVFPPGDGNLLPILEKMYEATKNNQPFEAMAALGLINGKHLLYFGAQFLLLLLNLFFTYLYANAYVSERANEKASHGMLLLLKSVPKLIGMGALFLLPIFLSSLLMFIPLIFLALSFFFAPVFASMEKAKTLEALEASSRLSKGYRIAMGFSFLLQIFIVNLPVNLLLGLMDPESNVALVLTAFFNTLFILMRGRLIGMFYQFFRVQLMNKKMEEVLTMERAEWLKAMNDSQSGEDEK